MGIEFVRYYLLKEASKYISSSILSAIELDNQSYFKYALFYDASFYYKLFRPFKKDNFRISYEIQKDNFKPFLKECLDNAYYHANANEKFFCYMIFMSYAIDKSFTPYLEAFTTKKRKRHYLEQMLNSYFFNSFEKIAIHKVNLADYFFNSFALAEEDIELIDKPLKRVFGFFCAKNYYQNCYHNARIYYSHFAKDFFKLKKLLLSSYDFFLNHHKNKPKLRHLFYHKKIDTTTLNLKKEAYSYQDIEYNYSVEELFQKTVKELKEIADILNTYFNFHQDLKPFEKYFNPTKK